MDSGESAGFKYITDAEALGRAVEAMSREPVLAFDLESDNNLHHYGSKICLIQFATPRANYLVDALEGLDLSPVKEIMESAEIEIIMHDADFDMRSLDNEFGWRPKNLFDTLIAARLCGRKSFGIAALIEEGFGVKLLKKYQRADWSRRPLTDPMLEYAAGDVHYLLRLRERFTEELGGLGRESWAAEEFRRRESIRFEPDDRPLFARVKGASKLDGRRLAVLQELALARDEIARRLDMPTYMVIPDHALVGLVERPPKKASAMKGMRGIHPHCRGAGAKAIVDAIERGRVGKRLEWPKKKRLGKRLHQTPRLLAKLKEWRQWAALREGLEPDLIMPLIALKRLAGGLLPADVLRDDPVREWQREAFGAELTELLK